MRIFATLRKMRWDPTKLTGPVPGRRRNRREHCHGCGHARTSARESLATTGYVYLFGAAYAEGRLAVGRANAESMNERLALAFVRPGRHRVLVLDGAGWHKCEELPENIILLLLQPYSPESKENVALETKSLRESCV